MDEFVSTEMMQELEKCLVAGKWTGNEKHIVRTRILWALSSNGKYLLDKYGSIANLMFLSNEELSEQSSEMENEKHTNEREKEYNTLLTQEPGGTEYEIRCACGARIEFDLRITRSIDEGQTVFTRCTRPGCTVIAGKENT